MGVGPLGSNPCSTCPVRPARARHRPRAVALRLRRGRAHGRAASSAVGLRRASAPPDDSAAGPACDARRRSRGARRRGAARRRSPSSGCCSRSNARTAMSVGQASGLALVVAARAGIPVVAVQPERGEARRHRRRRGRQGSRCRRWSRGCSTCRESRKPADAADALALALCHSWRAIDARARVDASAVAAATVIAPLRRPR